MRAVVESCEARFVSVRERMHINTIIWILVLISPGLVFANDHVYQTYSSESPYAAAIEKAAGAVKIASPHSMSIKVVEAEVFALPAVSYQDIGLPENEKRNKKHRVSVHREIGVDLSRYWRLVDTIGDMNIWRMVIRSPNAYFIRPHISVDDVGVKYIKVYGGELAKEVGVQDADKLDAKAGIWNGVVKGEYLYIEVGKAGNKEKPNITIDKISHGFAEPLTLEIKDSTYPTKEQSCHNDVMCYSDYSAERKGVLWLYFEEDGFGYVCSGSLVMDLSGSYANWLLTAHHCINNQTAADSLIAVFNYTTSTCDGAVTDIWSYPSVSGATYKISRSVDLSSDFSLLELDSNPPDSADYGYLGWTTSPLASAESVVGIHHPDGSYKRISFGNEDDDPITPDRLWDVLWADGTTEGGSSGSPLFAADTKQIVGTLYGGYASCIATDSHDWYGKFSVSWDEGLSEYLGNGAYSRPARPVVNASDGTYIDRVSVSWSEVSGATSYRIYRCTDTTISSCGSYYSSVYSPYDDTGAVSGVTYYYRIKACNTTGCSNYSDYNTGYRGISQPTHVTDDYNGDGKADILVRRVSDGYLFMYEMDGNTRTGKNIGGLSTDWTVEGVGDFNGDGMTDILIRRASDGYLFMYEMDGNVRTGKNIGGLSVDWKVEGVGDFNGDSKDDILVRRTSDGYLFMYEMDGNVRTGKNIGGLSTDWEVHGLGDFNGDDKSDILIRRVSDGYLFMYEMDGNIRTGKNIGGLSNDWTIEGLGDFNGDGKDDILIRRTSDGYLFMYEMNGSARTGKSIGGMDTAWSIERVADYGGDSKTDILIRRISDGYLMMYEMDSNVRTSKNVGSLNISWQVEVQ